MAGSLPWLAYCVAALLAIHVASILLAVSAMTRRAPTGRPDQPGITVVRPVCGKCAPNAWLEKPAAEIGGCWT